MVSINLFCCCTRSFLNSLKHRRYADYADADYAHAKIVCKDFELKYYVNTFMFNFLNMCIKIFEIDSAHFPLIPGLACSHKKGKSIHGRL